MAKAVSKSAYSAGAREERREVLAYLRRQARKYQVSAAIRNAIAWMVTREKRYAKRKGGL